MALQDSGGDGDDENRSIVVHVVDVVTVWSSRMRCDKSGPRPGEHGCSTVLVAS